MPEYGESRQAADFHGVQTVLGPAHRTEHPAEHDVYQVAELLQIERTLLYDQPDPGACGDPQRNGESSVLRVPLLQGNPSDQIR